MPRSLAAVCGQLDWEFYTRLCVGECICTLLASASTEA
jgi:hypothetical protein